MIVQIAAFTEQGKKTAYEITRTPSVDNYSYYDKSKDTLSEWTKDAFANRRALIFVGAMGIAVRTIAPYIKSKLTDSPVIVVDEKGQFVIPILSGHVGGANELAHKIAEHLGAVAVITTATDINDVFAVDVFAVKNGLEILNKKGIQAVSSKILEGERATISFPLEKIGKLPQELIYIDYPPKINVDIIISEDDELLKKATFPLRPKKKILGIGCKKGKSCEDIEELVDECGVDMNQIYAVASIDIKKNEAGIIQFSNKYRIEFMTYTKEELMRIEGDFSASEFVNSTVGVDNVCERSALLCAGKNGRILQKKTAKNGVTLAVAERDWEIDFE